MLIHGEIWHSLDINWTVIIVHFNPCAYKAVLIYYCPCYCTEDTRHMALPTSSATRMAPVVSTTTLTGRP